MSKMRASSSQPLSPSGQMHRTRMISPSSMPPKDHEAQKMVAPSPQPQVHATRMISLSSMPPNTVVLDESVAAPPPHYPPVPPPHYHRRRICGTALHHLKYCKRWWWGRPYLSVTRTVLQSMQVSVHVEATSAVVVVEQTYRNDSANPVEAVFKMGLGDELAVFGFEVERDGKVVKAEIKPTAQARDDYDDAISMGHTGVMGEVNADGSFEMSIGNIPSQTCITIRARIIAPIHSDQETISFALPSDFFPSAKLPYKLTLKGSASFPGGIESMAVIHGVTTSVTELPFFSSDQRPADNGVFALEVTPKHLFEPSVALEDDGKSLAAALTFFPSWEHIDPDLLTPYVEAVFLVDRSGSMGGGFGPNRGGRIVKARDTLQLFLSSLPENCKFQIIGFGGRHELLFQSGSVVYQPKTLQAAQKHVASMQADLGGTNLLAPLQQVLSSSSEADFPRHVFILTDGQVSNREETIAYVQKHRGNTVVHAVGIGSGADKALVDGVAHAGNGLADMIPDNGDMRGVVIRQLSKALEPTLRKVELHWTDAEAERLVPDAALLPPVVNGDRLNVYALGVKFTGPEPSLRLTGVAPDDEPFSAVLSLKDLVHSKGADSPIHHLAAWRAIRDLERDGSKSAKAMIEKLGLTYSLASSQTAFSAMFENEKMPEGEMKVAEVPGLASGQQAEVFAAQGGVRNAIRDKLRQKKGGGRGAGLQQASSLVPDSRPMMRGRRSSVEERSRAPMPSASPRVASAQHFDSADWAMRPSSHNTISSSSSLSSARKELPAHLKKSGGSPPPPPAAPSAAAPRRRLSNESREEKEEDYACLSVDDLTSSGNFVTEDLPIPEAPKSKKAPAAKGPAKSATFSGPPKPAPARPLSSSPAGAASTGMAGDIVMQCAQLQHATGFWTVADAAKLTGIKDIDATCPNKAVDIQLWATALVVQFLAKLHADKENEWKLLATKARTYIKKALLKAGVSDDFLALAALRF